MGGSCGPFGGVIAYQALPTLKACSKVCSTIHTTLFYFLDGHNHSFPLQHSGEARWLLSEAQERHEHTARRQRKPVEMKRYSCYNRDAGLMSTKEGVSNTPYGIIIASVLRDRLKFVGTEAPQV